MITEVTRRDILEMLEKSLDTGNFIYYGRLNEVDFFNRLYPLQNLPSTDSRFQFNNAQKDIIQHRVNNDDWEWDWFYQYYNDNFDLVANDKKFLEFLCETLHPTVVDKESNWKDILKKYNELLKYDGYKIVKTENISGRAIYGFEEIAQNEIIDRYSNEIKEKFSSDYIDSQVSIMMDNIEKNPNVAIGKSKELIESCAKTILDEMNIEYNNKLDFTPLLKLVIKQLGLSSNNQDKENLSGQIAAKLLGNLSAIPQNMSELRNAFGDGHGKSKTFISLPPRYARLAVGTAATIVYFLWETYQSRKASF